MQLEKECQVYGRGGWGPCLFLLPEMCVLQLLGFVQDMIWKELKQQRLEPWPMKWQVWGRMLKDGIEAKSLDVFLLSRPLSCSRHCFPSHPAEPLGRGISVPASLTLLPSSLSGPVPPAPLSVASQVGGLLCSLVPPGTLSLVPGCTQRTCAGVPQSRACRQTSVLTSSPISSRLVQRLT